MIGNPNDETNFPHKLLLTYTQVSKNRKAFANGPSANIKFSKTQLSKIVQLGGFVTGMTGIVKPENEIFKTANGLLSLTNSIAKKSASMGNKGTLVNAGLSLLGQKIKKKNYGSGITLTNNEIKDIMKVIKSLENRGILLKGTTAKITGQEGGFLIFLNH